MSNQVTTAFVEGYNSGITMLAQQLMEQTRSAATNLGSMSAKKQSFDQLGTVRLQARTARHADIPTVETPHKRRWVTSQYFHGRDFIDEADKLQMLSDPTNPYTQAFGAAAARHFDRVIVQGALGTALTGEDGSTGTVLPSAQKIVNGSTGFTFTKLKQAVRLLKQRHALQKGDEIYCAWGSRQEEEFINTTEVKSSDFTQKRFIDMGGVDEFYRVRFIQLEDEDETPEGRILPIAGGIRSCPVWVKRHVGYAIRKEPGGRVAWLDEKEAWQVSGFIDVGATRLQEVGVVQLDVVES